MSLDPAVVLQDALRDRYRIERLLGRGGMARVYLAQDLKHDRQVAVKVLRPELTVTLGRDRFLREIQIAARLNHPHILALHDSGDANGLLYYVMPYVEGESVFQLLERQGPQPIEEAVRIAREVATALSYAHARGVLHRDIKPGNILLSDGHAVVADFGLARAVTEAQTDRSITGEGLTIGTPAYMSPEQGMGEEGLDARSDVYSLGCVLYELLAGNPPYTASNPHAILGKHAHDPIPSIRTVRPEVPEWLDRALQKALAKEPADRFGSAAELGEALQLPGEESVDHVRALGRWRVGALTGAVLGAIAIAYALYRNTDSAPPAPAPADTTRYTILPFDYATGAAARPEDHQLFRDGVARWRGVSIADPNKVSEEVAREPGGRLSATAATRVARAAGAGRFFRGELSPLGDSLRLRFALYDVQKGPDPLSEATGSLPRSRAGADSVIRNVVDRLLLFRGPEGSPSGPAPATSILAAAQLWLQAQTAIGRWDLVGADTAFSAAARTDPQFAEALIWQAMVRSWRGAPSSEWRFAAEQAATHRERLQTRDRHRADALLAQADRRYDVASRIWRELTREDPRDFAAWYGLATAARADVIVVPDRASPSGWRFRSSYHEAVQAFRRAFTLQPAIHRALRTGSFERVRDLLFTSVGRTRAGQPLGTDSVLFVAYPGWEGDTLTFIPWPASDLQRGDPRVVPTSREQAIRQQRRIFHELAQAWATADPSSPHAFEALAVALEMIGHPAALDTLRRARALARSPTERIEVGAAEVWLRLRLAIPDDPAGLGRVRSLADSLLAEGKNADADPNMLSGIAALRGRVTEAVRFSSVATMRRMVPTPAAVPLTRDGPALLMYSAFGAPADSIARLERRVVAAIEGSLPEGDRLDARREWLARPATLAFPDIRFESLTALEGMGDPLLDAQVAAWARQADSAGRYFQTTREQRRSIPPEVLSFDGLYPEARLLILLGDTAGALAWVDPSLRALGRTEPRRLAVPVNVASLLRLIALRADLAEQRKDSHSARSWARVIAILWEGADQELQPLVRRMRALSQ